MTIRIGVDVDIVLAQSDIKWLEWLQRVTNHTPHLEKFNGKYHYDLSLYFKDHLNNIDPFDFWRSEGVYCWIDPEQGSQRALVELKSQLDCEIVAISHCKGNHFKSKWQFLKRNFGDNIDGFVATKEKHLVRCDYIIDDRNSYLNKMPEDVTCIRLETPYTQCSEPTREIIVKENWNSVVDFILNKEK